MNTFLRTVASAALAASLSGCVSYFTGSPVFQPVAPPPDHGVIYVLRPTSQFGMLQDISAGLDKERWFTLYPGTYGAFYVKPGRVKLRLAIDAWASAGMFSGGIGGAGFTIITAGAEGDSKSAIVDVDVPSGGAVYVRTAVAGWKEAPELEVLSAADGMSDIADLHLTAGGRPHAPQPSPPASPMAGSSTGPATPAPLPARPAKGPTEPPLPPSPAIDPTLDNVFLKDGKVVSGTIVAEDAKSVSIMLKEGFGKVISTSDVARIERRSK